MQITKFFVIYLIDLTIFNDNNDLGKHKKKTA